MQQKVVIIGAGGHAKVIADIIIKSRDCLLGFLDDNISEGTKIIKEYTILGKIENCLDLYNKDDTIQFIIAIGNNSIRKQIATKYKIPYYTAIHPTATIGLEIKIGKGTVIMANACINSNTTIGKHCIINTGSIVEHDNIIENFVHLSPNVTLGGTVKIGEKAHIGIGATVKNNITIGANTTIGAGAVVVKDIIEKGTYIGIPAKMINKD